MRTELCVEEIGQDPEKLERLVQLAPANVKRPTGVSDAVASAYDFLELARDESRRDRFSTCLLEWCLKLAEDIGHARMALT